MNDAATIGKAPTPWFRQRWPWLLIAGPGIVVVASIYTGWLALSTDDGVVTDDYYRRGLTINKRLERVDRAAALQLSARVDVATDGEVRLQLSSPSRELQALPAVVRLAIAHPTRAGFDRDADLLRGPDGYYSGRIEPVRDGRVLTVDVLRDREPHAAFESVEKARRWVRKLGETAPIAAKGRRTP